jgi:hypothetical protein
MIMKVSMKFVWQETSMLSEVWETCTDIHVSQFNIYNLNTVDIHQTILDVTVIQVIIN